MTRITHTQIEITKNPLMKIVVEVPQWEAHVVLALWGEDANVTGTVVRERKVPQSNDEFTRLANKYGPPDEDIPFVARVYGSFGPGLRSLENEFQVSVAGSNIPSQAAQVSEVAIEKIAPAQLAGFEGSKAPAAPVDVDAPAKTVAQGLAAAPELSLETPVELGDTELTDAQIDTIDNVDSLAGNTVDGVPIKEFINDVSDLTGDMETAKEA
jgi:hypothetical protein